MPGRTIAAIPLPLRLSVPSNRLAPLDCSSPEFLAFSPRILHFVSFGFPWSGEFRVLSLIRGLHHAEDEAWAGGDAR